MVKLWSHHPSDFRLETASNVDYKKGKYWNSNDPNLRYREVLPLLHGRVGTDQFLWCCAVRGEFQRTAEEIDLVEWELNVPRSAVLAFYRASIWEDIVWGRSDAWDELFTGTETEANVVSTKIGALVRFPLHPEWVTCHGPPPVRYPRLLT